jgi:Family of unknown function (DUF6252)
MRRSAFLALLLVTACGVDVTRAPSGNGDGNMFATVDGASWSGSLNVQTTRNGNKLTIAGFASNQRRMTLSLDNAGAPGTYQIGAGGASYGEFWEGGLIWLSNSPGGSGSVTFSVLTAKRGTGTFTFTAPASTATGATGNKVVTTGTFDVQFIQ